MKVRVIVSEFHDFELNEIKVKNDEYTVSKKRFDEVNEYGKANGFGNIYEEIKEIKKK